METSTKPTRLLPSLSVHMGTCWNKPILLTSKFLTNIGLPPSAIQGPSVIMYVLVLPVGNLPDKLPSSADIQHPIQMLLPPGSQY